MAIKGQEYTCTACGQQVIFQFEDEESVAVKEYTEGLQCPVCKERQSFKRGTGRDLGQSHLLYGPCAKCNSQTEYLSCQMARIPFTAQNVPVPIHHPPTDEDEWVFLKN
jgi:hypothetical protein